MHMAAAVPEHHLASRLRIDVVAQVVVGTEDELGVLGESFDNLLALLDVTTTSVSALTAAVVLTYDTTW